MGSVAEYSAARMAKASERAPIGSRWGEWTITSLAFREISPAGYDTTYIMARCSCGTERKMHLHSLIDRGSKGCPKCSAKAAASLRKNYTGSENPNWKGDDHPREPYAYAKRLRVEQGDICAWPPCRKRLTGRVAVDHRHDTCCPGKKTCRHCVRGVVHHLCNILGIAGAERAMSLGGVMPSHIEAYMTNSTSNQEAS